ncbi:hypothetical protein [Streptomyces sp. enrichment culture]|uniref:hypothetical protein n=1 Tax=Streptomyces sp. enrichment culture TaxID=1795815 RepID=UPI003F5655FF
MTGSSWGWASRTARWTAAACSASQTDSIRHASPRCTTPTSSYGWAPGSGCQVPVTFQMLEHRA